MGKKLGPAKWTVKKVTAKNATVLLQNVRIAFVHVARPAMFNDSDPAYQVTGLIPAKEFPAIFKAAEKTVKELLALNKTLKDKAKATALKTALATSEAGALFKDGEDSTNSEGVVYDGFLNHFSLRAKTKAEQLDDDSFKSKVPITIVDSRNNPIPRDELDDKIYSGCWVDLYISLKAYDQTGATKPGISIYLSGIQKLKDDDRLGVSNPFSSRDDISDLDDYDEDEDEDEEEEIEDDEDEDEDEVPVRRPKKSTPKKPTKAKPKKATPKKKPGRR